MRYFDRAEAGRDLAFRLEKYQGDDPIVLGLVRGGIAVAAEVAAGLRAPLDALVVRKVGVPARHELGMGAVAAGTTWLNEPLIAQLGIPRRDVDRAIAEEAKEVERREVLYRRGRPAIAVAPVCSLQGLARVGREADEVVCTASPADFFAVSQAYVSFPQLTDEAVRQHLDAAAASGAAEPGRSK